MIENRRLRNVNLLYTISLALVVTVGALMQMRSLKWGLIGTEALLIFLPAWIYVRYVDRQATSKLRLRWPGVRAVLAGLMVGVGMGVLSTALEVLARIRFGYALWMPPGAYPTNTFDAIVLFLAFAVAAPICEEYMFRGVIQPVYERRAPWVGIIVGGLLFAFFHVRFQGLLPLLPIALTLGYVVWRSDSLITGIMTHFGVNAFSSSMMILTSFRPDINFNLSVELLGLALVLTGVGLWMLSRGEKVQSNGVEEDGRQEGGREGDITPGAGERGAQRKGVLGRLSYSWPLLVAAFIYVFMAGVEVLTFAPSSVIGNRELTFRPEGKVTAARWTYEIQDPSGEPIGTATYQLEKEDEHLVLSWNVQYAAFRKQVGPNSVYQSEAVAKSGQATWESDSLQLVALQGEDDELAWSVKRGNEGLALDVRLGDEVFPVLELPESALFKDEWPWRASLLPFQVGYRAQATLASPLRWSWEANRGEPGAQVIEISVLGGIPVGTPAGRFVAWIVSTSDGEAAWYDANPPYTLLRYTDGMVTYVLAGHEESDVNPAR